MAPLSVENPGMTDLQKIDGRIDRCIARRDRLQDQIGGIMRQIKNREKYLAHLGGIRSRIANFELTGVNEPTEGAMNSKKKLLDYRLALVKYYKDLANSVRDSTPPPIHKPTREDFGIVRVEEIFIAERVEKEVTPKPK